MLNPEENASFEAYSPFLDGELIEAETTTTAFGFEAETVESPFFSEYETGHGGCNCRSKEDIPNRN